MHLVAPQARPHLWGALRLKFHAIDPLGSLVSVYIFLKMTETGIAASATFLPRESVRCVSAGVQGVGPKAGRVGGGHRGWLGARHDSLGLQMSAQRPGTMKAPRPGWQPEAHESPVGFEVHGVAFLM